MVKRATLKLGGKILRIDPTPVDHVDEIRIIEKKIGPTTFKIPQPTQVPVDGDARYPVRADQDTPDTATVEITQRDDRPDWFHVRFLVANRQLSINPQGGLESRAAGSVDTWELFHGVSQPDGGAPHLVWPAFHGPVAVLEVLWQ